VRPVCVPCQRFFKAAKNGYYFIEAMPDGIRDPQPGTADPDHWTPYKLWVGDLYRCDGCGAEIVSGFGRAPIAEHYQADFAERVKAFGADQLQVNDC
jgi:hypothetical protein